MSGEMESGVMCIGMDRTGSVTKHTDEQKKEFVTGQTAIVLNNSFPEGDVLKISVCSHLAMMMLFKSLIWISKQFLMFSPS